MTADLRARIQAIVDGWPEDDLEFLLAELEYLADHQQVARPQVLATFQGMGDLTPELWEAWQRQLFSDDREQDNDE